MAVQCQLTNCMYTPVVMIIISLVVSSLVPRPSREGRPGNEARYMSLSILNTSLNVVDDSTITASLGASIYCKIEYINILYSAV